MLVSRMVGKMVFQLVASTDDQKVVKWVLKRAAPSVVVKVLKTVAKLVCRLVVRWVDTWDFWRVAHWAA